MFWRKGNGKAGDAVSLTPVEGPPISSEKLRAPLSAICTSWPRPSQINVYPHELQKTATDICLLNLNLIHILFHSS